jgi:hypothetical protein
MSPGEMAFRVARAVGHEPRRWTPPDAAVVERALAEARRAEAELRGGPPHRISFFAETLEFPGEAPIDWSRDYKSGVTAPLLFYRKLDYRDSGQVGDSKWTWELNRHQFLAPWAQEYRRTGDERHAAAVVAVICGWIGANPRYRGINWASALELALRILSWGIALDLCAASEAVRRARPVIGAAVAQQVRFIRRTLSRHSSANNHLVGELVGLLAAGAFFPEVPEASRHARFAARLLWKEALLQNESDGVNREQAAYYHHYTLEYLLTAGVLASRLGWTVPAEVLERTRRMLDFADAITDDSGQPFEIGDRDDGTVTGLNEGTGVTPWESLLWSGWVVFGDEDCGAHAARIAAARGGEPSPDARTVYWHGSRPAPPPRPPARRRWFPAGGYYIATDGGYTLLFKSGPFGYPSIAAHAHCDQLSVQVRLGDRTLLTDAGTYVYHTEDRWRRYFRGTTAHNTVGVDGLDQAEYAGPFMWATHARGRLEVSAEDAEGYDVRGSHDGFRRLDDPVEHERRVSYRRRLGYRVVDRLTGARPHRFDLYWNLGPEVVPRPLAQGRDAARRSWLLLHQGEPVLGLVVRAQQDLDVRELFGDEDVPAGFQSRRYLEKSPVHHIRASLTAPACLFETFLVPLGGGGDAAPEAILDRAEAWG